MSARATPRFTKPPHLRPLQVILLYMLHLQTAPPPFPRSIATLSLVTFALCSFHRSVSLVNYTFLHTRLGARLSSAANWGVNIERAHHGLPFSMLQSMCSRAHKRDELLLN